MNLPRISGLLLLFVSGLPLGAAEEISFATKDGRRFEKVLVTKVSDQKVEVLTSTGMESITRSELPDELQQRLVKEFNTVAAPKVGDVLSFTTTDQREVKDAILRRIAPTGLTLETRDGFEVFPFARLPAELGAQFDFDEEEVARHLAEERARQNAILQKQAAAAQLAQRAAQQRPASVAPPATPAPQQSRAATPHPDDRFGGRGSRLLGTPRLGGRGLDK